MTIEEFLAEWRNDSDRVLVHTSGSTGKPKPMWVEKQRMKNSASMTCDFLGLNEGDTALLCMPLDFIAGKMMVVRSLVRKMQLFCVTPSAHPLSASSLQSVGRQSFDFVAMTPMQVFSTLQVDEERDRLRNVRHLLIGGGAISKQLEDELRDFPHAVWSSYGMTETLSHIALRQINGESASLWYTPMNGVTVGQTSEQCLWIDAPQVAEGRIVTNDIVVMHDDGIRFRVIGRKDNTICSGGIKIQAEEVERLLTQHLTMPFTISKARDEKFGEVVVLLVVGKNITDSVSQVCKHSLPRYWQPKHIIEVDHLPQTATGKPNRAEAKKIVKKLLVSNVNGNDNGN